MPGDLQTNPLATLMRGTSGPPMAGAPPAGGMPGMGAPPNNALAQVLGSFFKQQQQVDPKQVADQLEQMKQVIASLLPRTMARGLSGVYTEIANMIKPLDRAIKAAKEALQADTAVRGPIGFSGSQPQGFGTPGGIIPR